MKKILSLVAVTAAAATLYLAWPSDDQNGVSATGSAMAPEQQPRPERSAAQPARPAAGAAHGPAWARSPFGPGTAAAEDLPRQIERRKELMKQGGYSTPDEYFTLPLRELQRRAKAGDLYALLQLGQQYYYEPDTLLAEDGFDPGADARAAGRRHFSDAAIGGHGQMPAVLMQLYAAEGDIVSAYAWQLFGEQMGEKYKTGPDIRMLSAMDRNNAKLQAERLYQLALNRLPATASTVP